MMQVKVHGTDVRGKCSMGEGETLKWHANLEMLWTTCTMQKNLKYRS